MNPIAVSDRGVASAPHHAAAEAGRAILAEGGNALEAMVAMAATIAVVYPHMNGLGSDGFWLVREPNGRAGVIEACGPAGELATIKAYRDKGYDALPPRGPDAAITVAGAVSGWNEALRHARSAGGRLPLDVLLSDAIGRARDGIAAARSVAETEVKAAEGLAAAPYFAAHFMPDGRMAAEGEQIRQVQLATTLEQLAHAGLDDFYRGDVGREIAADLARIGAPITRRDLDRYHARIREPLRLQLKSGTLLNSPPPTQGLASLLILGIAERLELGRSEGTAFVHGLVEATKRAFLIRDRVVTDPAQMDEDPRRYLEGDVLEREAARISSSRALDWPAPAEDTGDTIWMGCVDREGRAVSYIQSIYWEWGSGCVLPSTGILWQNRGVSFSLDPQARNPLAPGRLPFHTLNPPMAVLRDGRVISYGTMGGEGQPQTQAAMLVRYLGFGMNLAAAVDAPRWRLGKSWGEAETTLKVEPRFPDRIVEELLSLGHAVDVMEQPYAQEMGHAGLVVRHPDGRFEGVHDPRSDGGALGV